MSQQERAGAAANHKRPAGVSKHRVGILMASSIVIVALAAAALLWRSGTHRVEKPEGLSDAASAGSLTGAAPARESAEMPTRGAPSSGEETAFEVLKGRWLRPDGGYIVHIAGVAADGTIEAAYYNPRPIRISRASAARDDGAIRLFIELNDVGYPFCTYDLEYDPAGDRLLGIYVQTAIRQSFDVVFVRAP